MSDLEKVADVRVVDWSKYGDQYYGEMTEDGTIPVLNPDAEYRIIAESPFGVVYVYAEFAWPIDAWERAEAFAAKVRERGAINLEYWAYQRVAYGSAAYEEETSRMSPRQLAGEEDCPLR
jgi:hypothetical protein